MSLARSVTFLVGENGSGKSTFLEALAAAVGSPVVGGLDSERDPSLAHARRLAACLRLAWSKKTKRGFFMRAEDFFGFVQRLQSTRQELDEMSAEFEKTLTGYGLQLATGAIEGQRQGMTRRYGEDPDARSHGESFLKLFQARFIPDGLYLLDEPEAPLSPQRQFALLGIVKGMVEEGAQFVIATHSPILMALPGAEILSFDETPVRAVRFEDTEHVAFTKAFLANPERFLRQLD